MCKVSRKYTHRNAQLVARFFVAGKKNVVLTTLFIVFISIDRACNIVEAKSGVTMLNNVVNMHYDDACWPVKLQTHNF